MAIELQELEIQPLQKRERDEDGRTSESVIGDSETAQKGQHRAELSSHVEDTRHKASDSPAPGKRRRKRSRRLWYSLVACFCIRRQRHSSNGSLAKLHFAFPLPRKPCPPVSQFRLKQGHKLMFSVNYRDPHYIFTVTAAKKKLQKRELNWPLEESFVLILHKVRDTEGREMEAECSEPGEKGCSLKVHKNEIRKLGYVEEGMLHVTLKLNPKRVLPGNHDLTRRLPVQ